MRKVKQNNFLWVINPNHPLYDVNCAFHIHYRTNAGYMVRYCCEWFTIKENDCYPMIEA